jgi:Spy/CpxP family protein refolding chaperone
MADKLGLTPEQRRKIEAIQKKYDPINKRIQDKYQPRMEAIARKYQKESLTGTVENSPVAEARRKVVMAKFRKELEPIQAAAMREAAPIQKRAQDELMRALTPKQQTMLKKLQEEKKDDN